MEIQETKKCIVCHASQEEVPLTIFIYKDSEFYICPQHIPVLIHDPKKLTGLIPDAENLTAG